MIFLVKTWAWYDLSRQIWLPFGVYFICPNGTDSTWHIYSKHNTNPSPIRARFFHVVLLYKFPSNTRSPTPISMPLKSAIDIIYLFPNDLHPLVLYPDGVTFFSRTYVNVSKSGYVIHKVCGAIVLLWLSWVWCINLEKRILDGN